MTTSAAATGRTGDHGRRATAAIRAAAIPLAALVAVTAAAWALLLQVDMMASQAATFVGAWGLMMTAMMLPSAAPLVALYRQRGRALLVGGYLLVWTALGIPVYVLAETVDLMDMPAVAVAAVLAAAGVYQFMPLKEVCLRTCRSPLDFLALRWGRSPFRLGFEHGLYCVGCCWGLMAVLVLAAAMNLAAAALIAAVVFAEKVLPAGEWTARAAGVALLAVAAVVAI